MSETIWFYRYVEKNNDYDRGIDVVCIEMPVVKETPKGHWVSNRYHISTEGVKKWVSKTSKKRWVYPTKKQALFSFIRRKKNQIRILENRLGITKSALSIAENMYENNEEKSWQTI